MKWLESCALGLALCVGWGASWRRRRNATTAARARRFIFSIPMAIDWRPMSVTWPRDYAPVANILMRECAFTPATEAQLPVSS